MRQLKCFIASSFDSDEVNLIYKGMVFSALHELKIRPLRVDKINHNKKIDTKIIELIQECDFGIADLTFARPSVYYEAGYIEGLGKEVIYISRKDHFSPKSSDVRGNKKIHFDLITKNIIAWSTPNEKLKIKLIDRIKLITKPLYKEIDFHDKKLKENLKFQSLSLSDRIKIIDNLIKKYLETKKFKEVNKLHSNSIFLNVYIKQNNYVGFNISDSIFEKDLRFHARKDYMLVSIGTEKITRIICTLKKIPKTRIEKGLTLYKCIAKGVYQNEKSRFIFIDSISSELSFLEILKEIELSPIPDHT